MLFSEFSTKIFAYLLSLIYFCIINDNLYGCKSISN